MTAASAPAAGAPIEVEAGADALRDVLAAIRCARSGDRTGLDAITAGTTEARRALATLATIGTAMAMRGVSIGPAPAAGRPAELAAGVLDLMATLRAGDGKTFHVQINTLADPRGAFRAGAVMLAAAADRALLRSSDLDAIGRDFTDHLLDQPGLTSRKGR